MNRTRHVARLVARVLLAAGIVALAYAAYIVVDAKSFQSAEQTRFDLARQQAARMGATRAAAPALVDGGVLGKLEIPRLGMAVIVVQGDSEKVLRRAVGHLAGSALPGEMGNVVLAGHRDTFFRPLRNVRGGDVITLKTQQGDFEYVVESTAVVGPSDVRVLQPTGRPTLTLITCFPFFYLGPAPDRFVVRARETTRPRIAPVNDPS
jgi:sortase A